MLKDVPDLTVSRIGFGVTEMPVVGIGDTMKRTGTAIGLFVTPAALDVRTIDALYVDGPSDRALGVTVKVAGAVVESKLVVNQPDGPLP